jgi:hypothetical protein
MRCDLDPTALSRPGVPPRLAAVCRRSLAATPEGRPASASALAGELESAVAPRVLRRRIILGGVVAGLVVAAGLGAWLGWPRKAPPFTPTLEVLAVRKVRGAQRTLVNPPSLKNGDLVRVRCALPADRPLALFWRDSEGRWSELDDLDASDGKTVQYPSAAMVAVVGRPGTELILAVAGPKGGAAPTLEDVRALTTAEAWPVLPEDTRFWVSPDGVRTEKDDSRGPGARAPTALTEVEKSLKALRAKAGVRFDLFWGMTIRHQGGGRP